MTRAAGNVYPPKTGVNSATTICGVARPQAPAENRVTVAIWAGEKMFHQIKAPTLIVWGDQDTILPRSDQEALATAIPGSRLVVYPGAGHVFYWEEPARVAADLAAFVQTVSH